MLSQTMHFLFAIALMAVSSPRKVHRLSLGGSKPPPVSVLHVADDEELEIAGSHRAPFSSGVLASYLLTLPILRRVRNVPAGRRPYLRVGPGPASLGAGLRAVEVQVEDYAGPRCVSERETMGMILGARKEGLSAAAVVRARRATLIT